MPPVRILALPVLLIALAGAAGAQQPSAATISAALSALLATEADKADAEIRPIMPQTSKLPWGAVGFVDNGCTGALIGPRHVLAASHCFTFDYDSKPGAKVPYLQGAWQSGLVFFPNYHPDRPKPPRVAIDRVIVGSRVQNGAGPVAADWGIGHLAQPVTAFPAFTIDPRPGWHYPAFVSYAGYARDGTTYPGGPASYPQPAPGGYCANFTGNCWWIPAFTDPKCLARRHENGFVSLDDFSCLIQGGNSGSPVLWDVAAPGGTPDYRLTGLISGFGGFWSAERFRYAPRFAAGVAVAGHDDDPARTQVFATDSDLGRVVSRSRDGAGPSDPFSYFRDLGSVPAPGRLAAFKLKNGRPQIVSTSGNALRTSHVAQGSWQPWQTLASPPGSGASRDIDASYDVNGLPQLYVVAGNGLVYQRRASSTPDGTENRGDPGASNGAVWGPWLMLPGLSGAERLTAIRHADGRQQVFVLQDTGQIVEVHQLSASPASAWSAPATFRNANKLPILTDLDAAWTPAGQVQILAISSQGTGTSRAAATSSPTGGWSGWNGWSVPLYAPIAASPPALKGLVSLTASRWQEGGSAVVPVVFATDDQGNLYQTAFTGGQWQAWRSFYN